MRCRLGVWRGGQAVGWGGCYGVKGYGAVYLTFWGREGCVNGVRMCAQVKGGVGVERRSGPMAVFVEATCGRRAGGGVVVVVVGI